MAGEHSFMGRFTRRRRDKSAERSEFLNQLFPTLSRPDKPDHKTAMLCKQVERLLSMSLGGEISDPVLARLSIDSVQSAPGAGHLLVRVIVPSDLDVSMV